MAGRIDKIPVSPASPALPVCPMMDVLYLHGFNSSPQSLKVQETARWLQQHAANTRLHCPQLCVHPAQAIEQAQALLTSLPPDTLLIGSSLGGFYAAWLAQRFNRQAVLINPAVAPHRLLATLPRTHIHPYTAEHYTLDDDDLQALQAHCVPHPDPWRFWLVLGSADAVLDWREAARHFRGCRQTIFNGDDHRLQRWPEWLPQLPTFYQHAGVQT